MKSRVEEQGMRLLSFCITALATLTGVRRRFRLISDNG